MSNYERSFLRGAFARAGQVSKVYGPGPQVFYRNIGNAIQKKLLEVPARVLHSRVPYGRDGYLKFLDVVEGQNLRIVRRETYQHSRLALINRRLRRGRGIGWKRLGLQVPEHRMPEKQGGEKSA